MKGYNNYIVVLWESYVLLFSFDLKLIGFVSDTPHRSEES